ncbi:MAG: hypothetical protein COA82_12030 [Alkaliphilus sp.]|nr:FHA domain-containing protein [bacterium AH-315-K05]MBN4074742.1 FHA domain-containing protein [bacterium AH-315-E09]PHS29958.1 MAG: hypothetical protein COA82_12030 [Alkaliphilus sp.]
MKNTCEKFKTTYISDAKASYHVVELGEANGIYEHQVKILTKYPVHSVLQFRIINKEESIFIYYDITSKQTLDKLLLRKKLKRNEFIKILVEICKIILKSDNYLLIENNFLISDNNIYINPYTLEISLVYLPVKVERECVNTQISLLVNKLILALDEREASIDSFIHKTMVEVNKENFSVKRLLDFLMLKLFKEREEETKEKTEKHNEGATIKNEVYDEEKTEKNFRERKNNIEANKFTHGKEVFKERVKEIVENARAKKKTVFILIQVLVVLVILLVLIESKMFLLPGGETDILKLFATLLVIAALTALLSKKIFDSEKGVENVNTQKKQSIRHNKKNEAKERMKQIVAKRKKKSKNPKEIVLEKAVGLQSVNDNLINIKRENNIFATVLLDTDSREVATLSSTQEGKSRNIIIDNNPFIIGKLKEQVDYTITSTTVSRIHAEICFVNEGYYITDLNSKNGTKINGKKIASNKKYALKDGDIINIAAEEFKLNI